eukprot:SAG31_NODE_3897_length_3772_cov_2.529540_1_plen_28_part_10
MFRLLESASENAGLTNEVVSYKSSTILH